MTGNRRWLLSLLLPALLAPAGLLSSCVETGQAEKMGLPTPAATAVLEAFPGAIIVEHAVKGDTGRAQLYTAKFYADGLVRHVTVSADGIVTSVQETVCLTQLPAPAVAAIGKAAGVTEVVKQDVYAEVRDGQLVARSKPQTVYDVRLVHEGARGSLSVAPDGTVVEGPDWDRPAVKATPAVCPMGKSPDGACLKPQGDKGLCPMCKNAKCTCAKPQAPKAPTPPAHPGHQADRDKDE